MSQAPKDTTDPTTSTTSAAPTTATTAPAPRATSPLPGLVQRYLGSSKDPSAPSADTEQLLQKMAEEDAKIPTPTSPRPGIMNRYWSSPGRSSPGPAQEPEPAPYAEGSAKPPVKEPVKSTGKEAVKEPLKSTVKEPVKPTVKEPAKQLQPDAPVAPVRPISPSSPSIYQRYFGKKSEPEPEPVPEPKIPTLFPRKFQIASIGSGYHIKGADGPLYLARCHGFRNKPAIVLYKGLDTRSPPLACVIREGYRGRFNKKFTVTLDYFHPDPPSRLTRKRKDVNVASPSLKAEFYRDSESVESGKAAKSFADVDPSAKWTFSFDTGNQKEDFVWVLEAASRTDIWKAASGDHIKKEKGITSYNQPIGHGSLKQVKTGKVIAEFDEVKISYYRGKIEQRFSFCGESSLGDQFEVLAVTSMLGILHEKINDTTSDPPPPSGGPVRM